MLNKKTKCLLLHGFAGTPFEVEPIKNALEKIGVDVVSPTLPGHGKTFKEFCKTRFDDWLSYSKVILEDMLGDEQIVVVGFSLGGAIANALSQTYKVNGLVAIASPMWVYNFNPWSLRSYKMLSSPLLQYIYPVLKHKKRTEESKKIAPGQGYEGEIYLPHIVSMNKGLKTIRKNLKKTTCPTLLIHDIKDRTVDSSSSLYIAKKISSTNINLQFTNIKENITSHHLIATHTETSSLVCKLVEDFIIEL